MSLVHKYRPQSLQEIIGQATVARSLSQAIIKNRLHSSYLFTGTRGTGKTSAARVLVKSLNCELGQSVNPCGKCQSCVSIENGSAMDLVEVDCATNNGVDFARELTQRAGYSPMFGRYKVYILDEAHNLTKQANEALLKTIEEPGLKTLFILVTTNPEKILKTIESRCQKFHFNQVSDQDIFTHLLRIVNLEKLEVEQEILSTIAQSCDGIVRDAVTVLDQVSLDPTASDSSVYELLGKPDPLSVLDLLNAIAQGNVVAIYSELKAMSKSGVDPMQCLSEIANFVRNGIIAKQSPGSYNLMTCNTATFRSAGQWAKTYPQETLIQVQIFLRRAEIDFSSARNPRLFLEATLLELLDKLQSNAQVKQATINQSRQTQPKPFSKATNSHKGAMQPNPFLLEYIDPDLLIDPYLNEPKTEQEKTQYYWQQICLHESMSDCRSMITHYSWVGSSIQLLINGDLVVHAEFIRDSLRSAQYQALGMKPYEYHQIQITTTMLPNQAEPFKRSDF